MKATRGSGQHAFAIGGICVVVWGIRPTAETVREVTTALLEQRRAVQKPLALVVIADPAMKEPDQSARDEFIRCGPSFAAACSCAFAVVSPAAEQRQVQIGSFEALKAFNPIPSEICDSLEYALQRASLATGADPDAVIAKARAMGLGNGDGPA